MTNYGRDVFTGFVQPILDACPRLESIELRSMKLDASAIAKIYAAEPWIRSIELQSDRCEITFEDLMGTRNNIYLRELAVPWPWVSGPPRLSFGICERLAHSLAELDIVELRKDLLDNPPTTPLAESDVRAIALDRGRYESEDLWSEILRRQQLKVRNFLIRSRLVCTFAQYLPPSILNYHSIRCANIWAGRKILF